MTMYRLYERIQHFRSIGVPKLSPGYGPGAVLLPLILLLLLLSLLLLFIKFFFSLYLLTTVD